MPMRKRRSSGVLSLLSPFLLAALLLAILTGRQIYATLHHDTIFEAIRQNDAARVIALLRAGVDPNTREVGPARDFNDYANRRFSTQSNLRSSTPLLAALYSVEHPIPNSTNIQYNPHPNLAIIRALLEHGADARALDDTQTPPLSFAVRSGDVAVVDLLVRHGAKLDEQHPWGPSLIEAAAMGQTKMLRYLLEQGADVNTTNGNGETALIYTVKYARQPDSVRLLLERHIHVNARDRFRKTALWHAQHPFPQLSARQTQRLPEIITLLKAAGAK